MILLSRVLELLPLVGRECDLSVFAPAWSVRVLAAVPRPTALALVLVIAPVPGLALVRALALALAASLRE